MRKKLRIGQVAPVWYAIPPKKYGGIERIISFITEELVRRGHEVTLFAPGNSKTEAELVSLIKKGAMSSGADWGDYWWNLFNHSVAFEAADQFDIIHCHWMVMGGFFQKFVNTSVIHTLHNIPPAKNSRWEIFKHYRDILNLVFISESERRNSPVNFKNNWVVYNAIDFSRFQFNKKPQNHLAWIARICPAKGTKEAIQIAKKTGDKLLIAGQIQPHYRDYFEKEIKPELNSQIKYVGELSQEELSDFYGSAKALLYPINWEEPFGLVMAEAMACGTPVIAFNRGSVPEVVEDNKTGFVVKDIPQAVKALKKIDQIKREDCRKRVEEKFSINNMVDGYEKAYYESLKK